MKTKRNVLIFLVLVSIVLLLVFAGCQNPSDQSDSESSIIASMGTGFFTFDLGEVTFGRTILPTIPSFAVYELNFFSGGTLVKTVDRFLTNPSDPVVLNIGTYDLNVTAYIDTGKTQPAAWGSKTDIAITNGATTSASVELAAITNNGKGTFKWKIYYPTSRVITGNIKITPIAGTSGTEQTKTLTGGATDSLALNAGYYRIVFTLRDNANDEGAERWEILHIYQNMESAFDCIFEDKYFRSYNTRVTNGNDSGEGSLREAIYTVLTDGTIVVDSSVGTITLTNQISISSKNFLLEGNGVTIKAPSLSNAALYFSSDAVGTIRRIHFTDMKAPAISNYGYNLNIESCIFSNTVNSSYDTAITCYYGNTNIKGSTFYKNSGDFGRVIYSFNNAITLTGNLFYGNTNATSYNWALVYAQSRELVTSNGYNVVDVPLGTSSGQSGWIGQSTDKVISRMPIAPASFRLLSGRGAQNVITSRPGEYPKVDFYGNTIPAANAAAGAVQVPASGYLVEVSVNNSVLGSAAITSVPTLNSDGLYTNDSVTFTATSTGPIGYSFQYWQVNNDQQLTSNPLILALTAHYTVQAVFGRELPGSVRRVLFSGPMATVNFTGLSNKDIYMVKINTSGFAVNAANTGGPSGSFPSPSPNFQSAEYTPGNELPRMGHPAADEFNANPPPITSEELRRSRASFVPPVVGDTRMFWVESYYNSGTFVQKQATLRATGKYGNIWIMNENYGSGGGNKISAAQAQTLADKFDLIYPIETNLLGFEYGGGPGGDGGKDGDPKIQILAYDIVNASGVVQASGFFWSKDFYGQSQLSTLKTNLAEIFYIDASQVKNVPVSTLIHEFQHMINFNVKYVKQGKNSESWFDEMLSMMAEDVIAPLIGVAPPTNSRIPTFLGSYYQVGITEWNTLEGYSYAKGYAFGAYLLRNYGGASLLQEILANDSTNIDSVTAALKTVNGSGLGFEEALKRFGEAMVFSGNGMPSDVLSFDKTVTKTIGSYNYTATRFNIWSDFGSTKPRIFNSTEQVNIRPYSLTVHQAAGWKNKSGSFNITLQRPADENVEFYLMVK